MKEDSYKNVGDTLLAKDDFISLKRLIVEK